MNKRRATRKQSSYKIPFKNKISAQDDSKPKIEQKEKVLKDGTEIKRQNQFKKLRNQKMKEQDESNFKQKDIEIDSSNVINFSGIEVNMSEEGNKLNIFGKDDENKADNSLKSKNSCSVIHSNGYISDGYDKITTDVNLLINEIINVCEKELKLTTFKQSQFETNFHKQKKEEWSIIKDIKSENQDMKDFLHNSSNKRNDNEKELEESNDLEDLKKVNYNCNFTLQSESTGVKVEDNGNFKRKNEQVQDEVSDTLLKNTKHKKQKVDSKGFYAENKYVNGNIDNFQEGNKNFDSFYTNRNENVSNSELKEDNSYVSENLTVKESQMIDNTSSNVKKKKSFNLEFPTKTENISLHILINKTEHFEENFTDLKSNLKTKPGSWNAQALQKKVLTIPCMSALDYFNVCKLTESEISNKADENSNLPSSSKEKNHSNTENLFTENISKTQKESNETEFASNDNIKEHTNEHQTKDLTSHKALISHQDKHPNKDINSSTSLTPAKTETNSNQDKIESPNLYTCDTINIVSRTLNVKRENNKGIGSSIFNEEFIAEKIIFREKEESDDDIIPTGVFKYLNEIFEYNTEKTSIDLKCATPTKSNEFISEEHIIDLPKCNSSKKEMNNTKDSTVSINNNLLKQADLKISETTTKVNLGKNEENIDEDINLLNIVNENTKLDNNEENIKLRERNEELTIEIKIKDTVHTTENNTNKARKFDEESSSVQRKTNEEKYFSDFDNCMEMDDDFDLTASQLSMLDANEKMESHSTNKINAEQQTDISGSTYSDIAPLMLEIINELHSLRESIEWLKEKLDDISSSKTNP